LDVFLEHGEGRKRELLSFIGIKKNGEKEKERNYLRESDQE